MPSAKIEREIMGIFGPSKGTSESAREMVCEYLTECGLNPEVALDFRDESVEGWSFSSGSAPVSVVIAKGANPQFLWVESRIVKLPTDPAQVEPMFRYCLSENRHGLVTIALDDEEGVVLVKSIRTLAGLDKEELEEMIDMVSGTADRLDNDLANRFGCEMMGEDPA